MGFRKEIFARWSRHGIVIFGIPISGEWAIARFIRETEEPLSARVYTYTRAYIYESIEALVKRLRARYGVNSWSRWSTVIEFPRGCAIATCSRADTSLEPGERWRGGGKERNERRKGERKREDRWVWVWPIRCDLIGKRGSDVSNHRLVIEGEPGRPHQDSIARDSTAVEEADESHLRQWRLIAVVSSGLGPRREALIFCYAACNWANHLPLSDRRNTRELFICIASCRVRSLSSLSHSALCTWRVLAFF